VTERAAPNSLDVLQAALEAERAALLGHDVQALVGATERKLTALRALETAAPPLDAFERIAALAELNKANGALLAKRRREVTWALRHLGRIEQTPGGYDARGAVGANLSGRAYGAV
jgi:hypothetical protein